MEISEQIRQRRMAAGLSQEELAERIYVTRQTLSSWETGKTYPDLNSLLQLSDVFHFFLDELASVEEKEMRRCQKITMIYTSLFTVIMLFVIGTVLVRML